MAKLVGNRYAQSLFEAGLEVEKIEEFYGELNELRNIFIKEETLFDLLQHPRVAKNEKKEVLSNIFSEKISQELLNFLYILVDKRREAFLFEIIEEFNKTYNKHHNIVNVEAVTAVSMDEKAIDRLKSKLEEKLNKNIILVNTVDTSVIGGVLLKVEDRYVDTTLASQLEAMERSIKGVSL